jgi:hypothetical protein
MQRKVEVHRRLAIKRVLVAVGGLATGLGLPVVRPAFAQTDQMTASGGGVNVKQMPAAEGDGTVALRESFGFDTHFAQCIVEDNPDAFAMVPQGPAYGLINNREKRERTCREGSCGRVGTGVDRVDRR